MNEHYCTYKDGMCELDVDEAYQQGKADALANKVNLIEDSNFNPQMLKSCTDTSYQCGYQQGKADALNIDLDTPMHFTDEQKAWIKKYISINGERQRTDGVKEFAEWLPQHFDLRFSNNPDVWLDEFLNHTTEKLVAEWQKGEE